MSKKRSARQPNSVFLKDGDGRTERLYRLMKQCQGSVHDISYSGDEFRYNMPFELGVAYALTRTSSKRIYVFEAKKYDLKKTLSDLSHFDPKIHSMKGEKALMAIYDCFDSPVLLNPSVIGRPIYRETIKRLPELRQGRKTIFHKSAFKQMLYFVSALTEDAIAGL